MWICVFATADHQMRTHEARTVDGGHSSPALRSLQSDAVNRHRPPSEDATDNRLHFRGRDILTTPPKRVSGPVLQFGW